MAWYRWWWCDERGHPQLRRLAGATRVRTGGSVRQANRSRAGCGPRVARGGPCQARVRGRTGNPTRPGVGLVVLRIRDEALISWFRTPWCLGAESTAWMDHGAPSTPANSPVCWPGWRCSRVQDPTGPSVGLTWDQRTRSLTAIIPVQPLGLTLVGGEQVHEWVSGWGDWLSHLGYPGVKHVVVTVHTGPGPPTHPGANQRRGSERGAGGHPAVG